MSTATLTLPMAGILCAIPFTIAVGQILFKQAGQKLADTGAPFYSLAWDPIFIGALALYGIATLVWIYVLKSVPLTFAYSFMALSFLFVPLLSAWFLGETLTLRYALGTALIMMGLVVVQS